MAIARTNIGTLSAFAALLLSGIAPAMAGEGGRKLSTTLTGAAEIPGPGDSDGKGSVTIRVNPGQSQVCYELAVSNIDTATAAHIHTGAVGVAGPVAVMLTAPASGTSSGCAQISRDLAKELIRSPQNYYVNVHTATYPNGAIRGQLAK
jgi:hypothetical protein